MVFLNVGCTALHTPPVGPNDISVRREDFGEDVIKSNRGCMTWKSSQYKFWYTYVLSNLVFISKKKLRILQYLNTAWTTILACRGSTDIAYRRGLSMPISGLWTSADTNQIAMNASFIYDSSIFAIVDIPLQNYVLFQKINFPDIGPAEDFSVGALCAAVFELLLVTCALRKLG